jgi:hypothetical protein
MVFAQEASFRYSRQLLGLATAVVALWICTLLRIALNSEIEMDNSLSLTCDGCGRPASPEHIARRLLRLEWSTRFRPIHIQTLLLGAIAPACDDEFAYSPNGKFSGEAAHLLKALNITTEGKTAEAVHAEIQRAGVFLTHIFECPLETDSFSKPDSGPLMLARLRVVAARIGGHFGQSAWFRFHGNSMFS